LNGTHDLLAERARVRLARNPAERVSLAALARQIAASESAIHRRFVSTVGETPLQHQIRLRVVQAIPLIQQKWKMDAVAVTVGWKGRKDLYRAIRTLTGFTPADIRALTDSETHAMVSRLSTRASNIGDRAAGIGYRLSAAGSSS
jgi:transcriptional regulator GlxA family with amidase domain